MTASKPHPEIFEKAAILGNKPYHAGMAASNGIEAANAAIKASSNSFHSKNQDYSKADLVIDDVGQISFKKIDNIFQSSIKE